MVSVVERDAIVSAAREHYDETVSFLQEMIRTPSVNPPGEYEVIHDLVKDATNRTAGSARRFGRRIRCSTISGWIWRIRDITYCRT